MLGTEVKAALIQHVARASVVEWVWVPPKSVIASSWLAEELNHL